MNPAPGDLHRSVKTIEMPERKETEDARMPFRDDVAQTIVIYERVNRHAATRTSSMIERHGIIEAISKLMTTAELQQGFRVLRDSGQLHRTFEAVVIRHRHLFRPDVVDAARWRLDHANELF